MKTSNRLGELTPVITMRSLVFCLTNEYGEEGTKDVLWIRQSKHLIVLTEMARGSSRETRPHNTSFRLDVN